MRKFVFAAAVLAAVAIPTISSATTNAKTTTTSIVHISAAASGLRYVQKVVHAYAGRIEIVFSNPSALKHNVNVENGEQELGKTKTVAHATTKLFITLKAGRYNFYCSVPGHEAAGMHGTLVVS